MSYHKVKFFLDQYHIMGYTINLDDSVDVEGDVHLSYKTFTQIPVKFNIVTGDFTCNNSRLTTLKNVPNYVGGSFRCQFNSLTSLKHSPSVVNKLYEISHNEISNMAGAPEKVGRINMHYLKLNTFEGCPRANEISMSGCIELLNKPDEIFRLFDLGFTPETIIQSELDLCAIYRQYTIKNIVNDHR